jgi:hypothetical protein
VIAPCFFAFAHRTTLVTPLGTVVGHHPNRHQVRAGPPHRGGPRRPALGFASAIGNVCSEVIEVAFRSRSGDIEFQEWGRQADPHPRRAAAAPGPWRLRVTTDPMGPGLDAMAAQFGGLLLAAGEACEAPDHGCPTVTMLAHERRTPRQPATGEYRRGPGRGVDGGGNRAGTPA